MDFDDAKENIQPLAAGRNASILHASLRVESPQELLAQRRELEQAIHGYTGDDPLEPWYTYISWIEQSFPSGGKETGLEEVLTKCLSRFENEERYFQDRRMIKLYMKFIDSHQHPMECYQQLFDAGIGTMVADFYICWAYHYDACGNTRKADEIFRRGVACRAQPLEELQEAHQHFGFSVAQRLLYQDDEDVKENTKRQFEERRLALTSLRGHRRKATVGSIRTGAAVKSYAAGTVQTTVGASSSMQSNTRMQVFHDENASPNLPLPITSTVETEREDPKSVVRSIIDAARNQENLKEPGPWNKAYDKKKSGKLFARPTRNTDLGFSIHEDVEMEDIEYEIFNKPIQPPITEGERNYDKPFKYPPNFKNKNVLQIEWLTPVTIENESDPRTLPNYNKCCLYPRPNVEFQPEEYRAYCWFGKRNISNEFTAKRERYWSNGINGNIRQYPNFAKQSRPQRLGVLDAYFEPEKKKELVVCFSELYDTSDKVEYQWEELMAKRLRRNDTILMTADMDETTCEISERVQRRKSFFPLRKSIAPRQTLIKPKTNDGDITDIAAYSELKEAKKIINYRNSVDIPNKMEILKESNELTVPPIKSVQTFEIFEDSNMITNTATAAVGKEIVVYQEEFPSAAGLDFKFKTPALPNTTALALGSQKGTTGNKLGFEIYTETSSIDSVPLAGGAEGAVGGVIFDPEETCSTQIFNVFIKSQSVSTPKAVQKVAPREFGTILKSIPSPLEILDSQDCPAAVEQSVDEQEKGVAEYSPLLVKQLSTILETSEHGTTQGTHTTGGTTTKSSNSTSDGEGEREVATRLVIPHTELEPLEEQSRESSTVPPEIIVPLDNSNTTTHGTDIPQPSTVEVVSPAHTRLQIGPESQALPAAPTSGLNFSIFEDEHTEALKVKQAGNFTRLDEREDTATGYAIRSIRFQEDKTETMPKMLLNSRSVVKFQEDKTETLPKILITQTSLGFETEKTDTMPKIPLEAPIITLVKNVSSNVDDSFEFFGQTPPGKSILHPRYEVSAFKECMEARTPATKRHCNVDTPDMKHLKPPRSTQKPSIATSGKSVIMSVKVPALFEDEVEKLNSTKSSESISKPLNTQKTIGLTVPAVHRTTARDSFEPDFSFIEESQPQPVCIADKVNTLINDDVNLKEIPSNVRSTTVDTNSEKLKVLKESQALHESAAKKAAERNEVQERQAKSDLGDSYLKNFSEIMDSQPLQSDNKWHRSATKSQRTEMQKTVNENISNSFLRDFSAVMESQPTKKESACQQIKSITNKDLSTDGKLEEELSQLTLSKRKSDEMAKFDLGNPYLKDFSIVMESQPGEIQREAYQTKSFANKQVIKQKSEEVKKIETRDCILNDLSLVMDSQSIVNEKQQRQDKYLSTTTATTPTTASLFTKPEVNHQRMLENKELYLKDFSFVPESQPDENTNHCHQNKTVSNKSSSEARQNQPIHINDSDIKHFSMALEAPVIESATKRPQEQLEKLALEPVVPAPPLIFPDSYMKDFSGFQGRLGDSTSSKKNSSRLLFLNESKKLIAPIPPMPPLNVDASKELKARLDAETPNKLYFLDKSRSSIAHPSLSNRLSAEKFFELNAETAMFSTNISMIKNSTLLPHDEQNILSAPTPIKETSVHIKLEDNEPVGDTNKQQQDKVFKTPPSLVNKLPLLAPNAPNVLLQSSLLQEKTKTNSTGAIPKTQSVKKTLLRESKIPQPLSNSKAPTKDVTHVEVDVPEVGGDDDDADGEMSIYFKHTPKTPKIQQHIWNEKSPSPRTPSKNVYVHRDVDLNVTNQIVENLNEDPQVNPFNAYLQGAFLEQIDFSNYIDELPNCMLVGHVSRLSNTSKVKVNDVEFDVLKLVGEGAYGVVYSSVNSKTGRKYALKQERPPNFWEYYICLEVHSRLNSDDLVCAFMSIDYALIGNNASILISPFSTYGSLITVCNKVKKHTLRNVDEYVVMLLTCELLSIIDHLHAVNIIHADIKADNFILMQKLDYHSTQYALQLIDFGVSIDMKLFKPGQTFNYVHNENAFKCVEMREGRPWTYQLDLYGLAGVIHVLLFGKFMDITQRANGTWMHKTHVPRYINRTLWDTIFQSLLNVRDCDSMPNLQNLRALIKEEIAEKEKFVVRKVAEFNSTLSA